MEMSQQDEKLRLEHDIERHREALQIPAFHPFEQIWLVGDWHGDSGILPLFPSDLLKHSGSH
jgi:hypothetical protein